VARRIRRRGERGISRKAIAQGTPECSVCTCMLVCAFLSASCTRDRGCSKHPAFPAPSLFWAKRYGATRANHAAGMRTCIPHVIASEAKQSISPRKDRWIASLAMTVAGSPDERSDIRGGRRVVPDVASLIRATGCLKIKSGADASRTCETISAAASKPPN